MLTCNSGGRFQFIPHLTSFEEGILINDDVSFTKANEAWNLFFTLTTSADFDFSVYDKKRKKKQTTNSNNLP